MVNATRRPLYTQEKVPVSVVQEAGWTPGPVSTRAENLFSTGILTPDRPVRSESLYRLSYRGPPQNKYKLLKIEKLDDVEKYSSARQPEMTIQYGACALHAR